MATGLALVTASLNAAVIGQLGILDDSANGGINPATGVAWAAGDTYRLVFTSSTVLRDATSSTIGDYHTAVTVAANTAGLSGNWFAIGTTDGTSGQANTNSTGTGVGIFGTDGTTKVADSYTDFWDGSLDNAMNFDENGTAVGSVSVATGMFQNGNQEGSGGRHLGGSTETPPKIPHGRATETDGKWARAYNGAASSDWRFYAMSDVLTTVPEPTSTALLGLGGLALLVRRRR